MPSKKHESRIKSRRIRVKGKEYTYYRVYLGSIDGKPKYEQFKSLAETKAFLKKHDEKQKVLSRKVGKGAKQLTDGKLRDAVTAIELLGKTSLTEAANFYIKHHNAPTSNRTVEEVYNELLENRIQNGCKAPTIRDIKEKLGRFLKDHGNIKIQEISLADLNKWLSKTAGNNLSQRKKYRTQLSGLFTLAFKREYISQNPVTKIEIPRVKNGKRPEVFTVSETKALMKAAEKENPEMIPYFALCLFAGIRPCYSIGEIGRLDWKNILFGSKQIWISQEVAKRPVHERYVDMPDNLVQWLLPFKKTKGSIYYSQHWCKKIRDCAEVKWANDITRHTFGTYHFGLHQSFDLTCEQMGTSRQIYKKHYKAVLENSPDTDPEEYWKILPKKTRSLARKVK